MPAPIFIGGAGRSGTTLVVDRIGLHPNISPIYETDFAVQIVGILSSNLPTQEAMGQIWNFMDKWTRQLPNRPHNKRDHERYHHGPHYLLFDRQTVLQRTRLFLEDVARGRAMTGLASMMSDLFAVHTRLDRKTRWANKTPSYVQLLPLLERMFPDMKFIHCVRDGRAVAASVLSRPWGPKTPEQAAAWWKRKAGAGLDYAASRPERVRVVHYEELVQHPAVALGPIIRWIGEEDGQQSLI